MNDLIKINELIASLKAAEKVQIDQFKRQLENKINNTEIKNVETNNTGNTETLLPFDNNNVEKNTNIILQKENNNIEIKKTARRNLKTKHIKSEKTPEKTPENTLENISNDIQENTLENISNDIPENTLENISNDIPENTLENISNDIPENTLENISNDISENTLENISNDISENTLENISNENNIIPKVPKDILVDIPEEKDKVNIKNNIKSVDIGFVLFCFDHRFINNTRELLDRDDEIKSFDYFALAGGSLGFLKDDFGCWNKTCMEHIELANSIHNIKKIIVIDHEDCEIYKKYYDDLKKHPRREKKYHINNLIEAVEFLEKKFQLKVDAFMLNLDGTFTKL